MPVIEPITSIRTSALSRRIMAAALLAVLPAAVALAQARLTPAEIDAKYKSDVQNCKTGAGGQDQAACLREAGAAREEARRGQLAATPQNTLDNNAMQRCQRLPADQRQNCMALMSQPTQTTGSVGSGGLLRMREFTVPAAPASTAPAAPMPGAMPVR